MKLYLSTLLILFLVLDTNSVSAGLPRVSPKLVRIIGKYIKKAFKVARKHPNESNPPPLIFPPPNSPPLPYSPSPNSAPLPYSPSPYSPSSPINGLSFVGHYLSYFGYLSSFTPSLDDETISAIKTYQNYFNLQVTGDPNEETLQQMLLPRCGVPDRNFFYYFTDHNVSLPKAGNQWFPKDKRNLTYGFLPDSNIPDNATTVFRNAFTRWAQATTVLNLSETTYNSADIKVGFYVFHDSEIENVVFGGSLIRLEPVSNSTTAEILLDASKYWALPSQNDSILGEEVLDLESVAMHQIGHLLGLDHSSEQDSVMYPAILPDEQRKVELSDSDEKNIRQQYYDHSGDRGNSRLLFTTLSLVLFTYMFLLY